MKKLSESMLEIAPDPLLRNGEFPHTQIYFPYGIPLRVQSNSARILEAAQQSWGLFRQVFDTAPLELHVGIAGDAEGALPPNPIFRSRRNLFTVTGDAEHFGVCDFETGFGLCWLTPRILNDLAAVRFFYLDALGYSLVTEALLTGVHGACVAWKGCGVLLCGDSQTGKSTLAYACARRGFTYVCDDGSFLVRAGSDRTVVGNPHSIRFRPSVTALFPELNEFIAARRANGKIAIEVATGALRLPDIAPHANVDFLVFLNRSQGPGAKLLPFSKQAALSHMQESVRYGRDSSLREQRESLHRLLEAGTYELGYSDLDSAIDRLQELLETA